MQTNNSHSHDRYDFTWFSLFILCCFCWQHSNSKSETKHHHHLPEFKVIWSSLEYSAGPRKSLSSLFCVGGRQVRICFCLNSPVRPKAPRCCGRLGPLCSPSPPSSFGPFCPHTQPRYAVTADRPPPYVPPSPARDVLLVTTQKKNK